jgi:hypothetical protein
MRFSQTRDVIQIVFPFTITGFFFGVCFHWITSLPSLTDFWFIRTDKFLLPTYKYHLAFSTTLLLGLITGYTIARLQPSLIGRKRPATIRLIGAVLLILASAPSSSFIAETILGPFAILLSLALFLLIVSISAWVFTGEWKWLGFTLIVLSPFMALAVTAMVSLPFNLSNPSMGFVQWSMVDYLLSVSLGYWLTEAKSHITTTTV